MKVTLYSVKDCVKCKMLGMLLDSKKLPYEKCMNEERMNELNIRSAPMLEVDGKLLGYKDALIWVNKSGE